MGIKDQFTDKRQTTNNTFVVNKCEISVLKKSLINILRIYCICQLVTKIMAKTIGVVVKLLNLKQLTYKVPKKSSSKLA